MAVSGEYRIGKISSFYFSSQNIHHRNSLDLVTKCINFYIVFISVGRNNLNNISLHAKRTGNEIHVITLILRIDQFVKKGFAVDCFTDANFKDEIAVFIGIGETVN